MARHFQAPKDRLGPASSIAKAACDLLRKEFHRPGRPRHVNGKAPIDLDVETYLKRRFLANYDCAWHGEETTQARIALGDV